ncbi:MAG: thiamine phosphate synthase [Actinobacteria bacterium]|nr:MAG: thiamine phosphate synthase [Actinomycetota bacterium]
MKGLYFITTEYPELKRSHYLVTKEAIEAGVKIVQYREKNKDFKTRFKEASRIKKLCDSNKVQFLVNDDVHLALMLNSGVHLGHDDMSIKQARQILGKKKIIGLSARNYEEAMQAANLAPDYLGVGPVFNTPSKDDAAPAIGLFELNRICQAVKLPVIAIGGITANNANDVYHAGASGIAVISAIAKAPDISSAVEELISA